MRKKSRSLRRSSRSQHEPMAVNESATRTRSCAPHKLDDQTTAPLAFVIIKVVLSRPAALGLAQGLSGGARGAARSIKLPYCESNVTVR